MELLKEIEKSFPKIEKFFSNGDLSGFLKTPFDNLEKYNYGPGTMIRLKLLRPKSTLYHLFVRAGFADKDEMTVTIIEEFYNYAKNARV